MCRNPDAHRNFQMVKETLKSITAIDMFCGAGGESTGLMQATAELGYKTELFAINHWERAIETHSANHPAANHLCESIEQLTPGKITRNKVSLLWASPECTHHSNARGGRPRDAQSRASAWHVLKWLQELYVERVIIENVKEFLDWGPLDENGKPLKEFKGETFKAFIQALRSLGYTVDWKILCAADYGDPTTRKRLFIQAVRGAKQIIWPKATHVSSQQNESNLIRWRSAKEIIDWNFKSQLISERKKPLADATIRRIEAGMRKYWGKYAEPFLVVLRGTSTDSPLSMPLPTVTTSGAHYGLVEPFITAIGQTSSRDRSLSLNQPLSTIVTKQEHCLIEPFITRFNGGDDRNHSIGEPLPVIDCSNRYGVLEPLLVKYYGGKGHVKPVDNPLDTITTKDHHALIEPFLVKFYGNGENIESVHNPLSTVTTKDRFGLVRGIPALSFRMLQPHELAAAQGFPGDYIFCGNKGEVVKQIGNAVPIKLSRALCLAALSA
jgi:DNA (cytosine-5)-methyltransferase 1